MAVAGPRQGRERDPAGNGPTVVGHGIIDDAMLYLTARRADDGALFRVFLTPDDLRRLVRRAMEQEETAAVVREIAG